MCAGGMTAAAGGVKGCAGVGHSRASPQESIQAATPPMHPRPEHPTPVPGCGAALCLWRWREIVRSEMKIALITRLLRRRFSWQGGAGRQRHVVGGIIGRQLTGYGRDAAQVLVRLVRICLCSPLPVSLEAIGCVDGRWVTQVQGLGEPAGALLHGLLGRLHRLQLPGPSCKLTACTLCRGRPGGLVR